MPYSITATMIPAATTISTPAVRRPAAPVATWETEEVGTWVGVYEEAVTFLAR